MAPPSGPPPSPEMPGPARARGEVAVAENARCVACHEAEAATWRGSLHARADLEPAYRRAFAIEPLPFCRSCHAPEAAPEAAESEAVAAIGVGCVTCHVTGEGVLAAPGGARADRRLAPHAVVRSEAFAGDGACARCHEFAFPGRGGPGGLRDGDLMQSTVREHAALGSTASCAACHMGEPGRRSHAFVASRDPAVVRSAASVSAVRLGPSRVRVTVTPRAKGHAFPTGDLFRRIEVLAEAEGVDGISLGRDVRYLTRHFRTRPGLVGRHLVLDDRPFGEPVVVELDVGRAGPIVFRVAYQRVAHPRGVDETDAEIEDEIVLASGSVDP